MFCYLHNTFNYMLDCVWVWGQLCATLYNPTDWSQAALSMGLSRQEYWSELPFPPPGDLPEPGIEPASLASPALPADSLPRNHPGSSCARLPYCKYSFFCP